MKKNVPDDHRIYFVWTAKTCRKDIIQWRMSTWHKTVEMPHMLFLNSFIKVLSRMSYKIEHGSKP